MSTDNENDKLWELLGKARQPEVSPFFARNVLREIRQSPRRAWSCWLMLLRSRIAASVAAVALISSGAAYCVHQKANSSTEIARIVGSPDFEIINNLDDALASYDSSIWLDDSSVN